MRHGKTNINNKWGRMWQKDIVTTVKAPVFRCFTSNKTDTEEFSKEGKSPVGIRT